MHARHNIPMQIEAKTSGDMSLVLIFSLDSIRKSVEPKWADGLIQSQIAKIEPVLVLWIFDEFAGHISDHTKFFLKSTLRACVLEVPLPISDAH